MFGFILRYADERLIKKYSSEMPIQLKMRFKDQQIFSQDQVAQVLQITRSGSGLLKHKKCLLISLLLSLLYLQVN